MSKIRRRRFLTLAGVLFAAPRAIWAQQADSVVVGLLGSGSLAAYSGAKGLLREVLVEVLRDSGYAARVESRFAEGKLERLPALAADLVQLKPRLIVVADAVSTQALKKATTAIPLIMAGASDVVSLGLVQSLARPGGNITGFSSPYGDEFTTKWVEFLKSVLPKASRMALLWNPEIPAARRRKAQMGRAAHAFGLELVSLEVRRAEDLEQAFEAFRRRGAAGLIVDNAPFVAMHASKILDFALRDRVPTMWGRRRFAEAGGLLAYGIDYSDIYRKVARYAVRILKGAKPADLPVEQPSKFELVINLKSAMALGLNIPQSILIQADQVIE